MKRPQAAAARLTLAQVCSEIGITRSTFYDWRSKGLAPKCSKLPNGQLRIDRDDLDAWWDTMKEAAA